MLHCVIGPLTTTQATRG